MADDATDYALAESDRREFMALETAVEHLAGLDDGQRNRVLRYLVDRFGTCGRWVAREEPHPHG